MTKDPEFIKWWEGNKKDIYDKTLTTSWGCVHHFTQIAFQVGKQLMASQPAVEADAQKSCRCYKFYKQQNSYSFCPDCGRDLRTA